MGGSGIFRYMHVPDTFVYPCASGNYSINYCGPAGMGQFLGPVQRKGRMAVSSDPMPDDTNNPPTGRPIRHPAEPKPARRDTAAPRRSGPGRARREQPRSTPGSPTPSGPSIPATIEAKQLAPEIRAELFTLDKTTADTVARHLVAAGELLDDDPHTALAHALAARNRSGRIAAIRTGNCTRISA